MNIWKVDIQLGDKYDTDSNWMVLNRFKVDDNYKFSKDIIDVKEHIDEWGCYLSPYVTTNPDRFKYKLYLNLNYRGCFKELFQFWSGYSHTSIDIIKTQIHNITIIRDSIIRDIRDDKLNEILNI